MIPILNVILILSVGFIVLIVVGNVYFFRKNKSKLTHLKRTIKVRPSKLRFVFTWFVLQICILIPLLIFIWIYPFDQEVKFGFLFLFIILILAVAIPAYSYYTILIFKGKLSGATLWGWKWGREEMAMSEIDKEKTSHRNIGRKLGFLIFYSTSGKKILSLGLDNSQVNQILELSSFATSKEK